MLVNFAYFRNHKYYIPGLYKNLIQVLDLGIAITIEAETSKSITIKEIKTGKQIKAVNKVPTTAYKDCSNALSELIEVNKLNKFNITSETINNNKF